MTRLWNDPAAFADEMVDGFVAANARHVRRVAGGVTRVMAAPAGQVAVVIGGGSGHYPAFAGLVGEGLAHAAAMGNIFASPSAQQIYTVAKTVEAGGGVLFAFGNYAGDVLNFGAAQERLRAEGVACETVVVTDDVKSAPITQRHLRRGIAGDLAVFRAAAAAAEAGQELRAVRTLAAKANERTRSVGVAFTGCTLPGAQRPLFVVPEGRMAIGLGIHGEPGVEETDVPSADELAELLVGALLDAAELPPGLPTTEGGRVVPILNGLGSIKNEELFVVYRRVARLLADAGVETVDPHVGEYCTSFDMAGVSLTLHWLDDELSQLWGTPADAPAYRRAALTVPRPAIAEGGESRLTVSEVVTTRGDAASRACAKTVIAVIDAITRTADDHVEEWGRLDAVAGDGDHGIGMQRGARAAWTAVRAATEAGAGAGSTLARAGHAWADKAGGTSGALWGSILSAIADRLGDAASPTASDVAAGVSDGCAAVIAYGKARVGDKTLVDALVPFSRELTRGVERGEDLVVAWRAAAASAARHANATAELMPRMGRARTHGRGSLGTPDPGAMSFARIATAVGEVLATTSGRNRV